MKRILLVFAVLAAGLMLFTPRTTYTSSPQPPVGKTGAPGEGSCTECHSGPAGSGNVAITFNGPGDKFIHDSTYEFTVTVNDPTKVRFGFSGITVDQIDSMAGTFMPINFGNTSLQPGAGLTKSYIGHANATTTNTWTFKWTAPPVAQNVTQVTFYVAGNAADGGGSNDGDIIYFGSHVVTPSAAGLGDDLSESIGLWVYGDQLIVSSVNGNIPYTIFDLGGRVMMSGLTDDHTGNSLIDISGLARGLYMATAGTGPDALSVKFLR